LLSLLCLLYLQRLLCLLYLLLTCLPPGGARSMSEGFGGAGATASVMEWISSRNNMGMAFTRSFYSKLVQCADDFCNYDDYNWDWSVQATGNRCFQPKFGRSVVAMAIGRPRVFHFGTCGLHMGKGSDCKADVSPIQRLLSANAASLFPAAITVGSNNVGSSQTNPNGGWGDVRDHKLCKLFANGFEERRRRLKTDDATA